MYFPNDPNRYYDQGVVIEDPLDPDLSYPMPDWAIAESDKDPTSPQGEQKSARYQDVLGKAKMNLASPFVGWFPFCRFKVGRGEIGFIYGVETCIMGVPGDITALWYTPEDPFSFITRFTVSFEDSPKWRLTLDGRRPNEQPRRAVMQHYPGPGPCHPELGEWNDGRFAFGCSGNKLKLMVPEATNAILWASIPPGLSIETWPNFWAGRLFGYTQSWTDNEAARQNARRAF